MKIQQNQNIAFCAKVDLINIPAEVQDSLAGTLATLGNDSFTHSVALQGDLAVVRTLHDGASGVETLGGPSQILRWKGETIHEFLNDVAVITRQKVERFLGK